jgi:dihydroorotase
MGVAVVNGKYIGGNESPTVRNFMIQNGRITGMGYIPDEDEANTQIIDITQSLLLPNTFDFVHASTRQSRVNYVQKLQENGLFHLAVLPYSEMCSLDTPDAIHEWVNTDLQCGSLQVIASATKKNEPHELAELSLMRQAGARGVYLGRIIENEALLKQALMIIDMIGCPIVVGPLTRMAANGTHLNEGAVSFKIGVLGESVHDEERETQKILSLIQQLTCVPVHFLAVSSPMAIQAIHQANTVYDGDITMGMSPFHTILSDAHLLTYPSELKFNPPLRTENHASALMTALKNGQISHLTARHSPPPIDTQPVSFFDALPHPQTSHHFFDAVSHTVIQAGCDLPTIQSLLSAPMAFQPERQNGLDLGDDASFIALKNTSSSHQKVRLFNHVDIELDGGVSLVMKNGDPQ